MVITSEAAAAAMSDPPDSSAPPTCAVRAQERRCTWTCGWCPPFLWVRSVGSVGCALPASPSARAKAGTAGPAALVPSPGQE